MIEKNDNFFNQLDSFLLVEYNSESNTSPINLSIKIV